MTGVQTCALPICFPVTIIKEWMGGLIRTDAAMADSGGGWTHEGQEEWIT